MMSCMSGGIFVCSVARTSEFGMLTQPKYCIMILNCYRNTTCHHEIKLNEVDNRRMHCRALLRY